MCYTVFNIISSGGGAHSSISCLRHSAEKWKVVGLIRNEAVVFFSSCHLHRGAMVDSASNRNEYQESS
jgi:hypothetical protein